MQTALIVVVSVALAVVVVGVVALLVWAFAAPGPDRKQQFKAALNEALAHPKPVEPEEVEYVRAGRGIPAPVGNAVLAERVRTLEAQAAVPTTLPAPSPTLTSAASTPGTAPATEPPKPSTTDPLAMIEQALKAPRNP